jgi:hypothetical protein
MRGVQARYMHVHVKSFYTSTFADKKAIMLETSRDSPRYLINTTGTTGQQQLSTRVFIQYGLESC